ncbi:MAG TPA: SMP-30/gluconolactonase/LRE family protein [Acidimicrobiia bacterium]|nr:SMP-30/gluconolactonase/LRE family protein [Acidimicrobiia bacterium]
MARRTLQLVKEFLFPDSAEHRAIPVLDGGLSPNDELGSFEELTPPGDLEPLDVLPTAGGVLASSGDAVWRIPAGGSGPEPFARLAGAAGPLAADAAGNVLVGVSGEGLVSLDAAGVPTPLCRDAAGGPLACLTALWVAADGTIYATEGSISSPREDWPRNLLERKHDGRLLAIEPGTGSARVVADGLAWPAGVCPAGDADHVLVTESWRHRIVRISTDTGATEVVRDNLAGYPAQIHADTGGRYWLCFLSLRSHLVEFVLREDEYRRDMLASVPPEFWIRPALRTTGERWEPLQIGQVKHLNVTKPWAPPRSYGLVARMDALGTFETSFHSRAGGVRHGCLSARPDSGGLLVACAGGRVVLRSPALSAETPEVRR